MKREVFCIQQNHVSHRKLYFATLRVKISLVALAGSMEESFSLRSKVFHALEKSFGGRNLITIATGPRKGGRYGRISTSVEKERGDTRYFMNGVIVRKLGRS
jgi:hypothetical protein